MDDDADDHLQALVLRAVSSDESGRSLPRSSSSDAAQRASATTAILSGVQSRKTPLVSLLQKMDSTLTSDDDGVRASATALLATCARTMSGMKNEEEEEEEEDDDARQQRRQKGLNESLLLTQFFAAKLRELCTLKHGLDGMLYSLRMTKRATRTTTTTKMDAMDEGEQKHDEGVDDDDGGPQTQTRRRERQRKNGGKHFSATMVNQCIDNAIKELFEHVHAPSLAHGDRQRFYAVVEEVLREFPRAMVLGGDFEEEEENASNAKEEDEKRKKAVGRLESIVANCDGERDPRNVLALCRLWQELPKAFNEAEGEEDVVATTTTSTTAQVFVANCEEVYDVVAAYFPISFKPPQNDSVKITREELASGLKAAMTATNCYAPFAIPHALESVVSSGEDEGVATAVSGEACADAIDCLETMGANWPDDDIATDEICANVWSRLRLCVISPRDLEWSKPVRRATARLFANGNSTFSKKILKLALEDQSVKACEQAFKAYKAHKMELHKDTSMMIELNSKEEKEEHAMEVDGEKENESSGCCGGGCGKTQHQAPPESDEIETAARVAAAVAGRCLGAAAAANVDAAKVATSEKLKKLLDAIRDEDANTDNNTNRDNMPDWRSIAMVLITTTIGGALDAALTSSSSLPSNSSVEEILGSELCDILRDTLVSGLRSFTCKAKDHDGVVLSIACASAYLQFPEFSKNGCGNAKKKAYADVLEALFWGATTASNEELVFSNSSTKKTKDDISSPTLADEADDRRLRIKDAIVIAINSDKSNGTLAGQLISSLIKKALFDESTGHANRRRRALELCLAIVITNEKNANNVGQRSFREKIVGELAKLIAENPALRLRATTASDCLLACLRGRALEKEIILAPGETPQNVKTSEDALSAELCARLALGALGFGLPEMNSNFACATMACSSSEAQIALVGLCASIILGQAKGNFENACASLCGARAVVLSDENNELLKLTVQRLVDVACAKKPYDAYSSLKRHAALHALTSMVHKRGLDRFFASEEKTLFSQRNVQKMVFDNEETSGLLLRSLLFSPDAKTALNAAKIELVSEAFLQLLLKGDEDEKAKHVAAAFYRAIEEEEKKRYGCTIDDEEEDFAYLLAGSSSSLSPLVSLSTSLLGFRSFEHGFRKPVRAQRYVTETTKRIRELAKNKVQPHIASAIVALASSSSALVSSSLANGDNCDFLLSCAVTVLKTTTTTTTISKETSDTIPTGALLIASTFFNSSSTHGKDLVEKHASKLLLSLCGACKSPSATVDFKVRALHTLAKCGNTLPFNAIYPSRFEVYENCRAFLDDPRRRVRRSAAKSCSSWAPLCSKI